MAEDRLDQLLQRHRAFWQRQGDAPLKQIRPHSPLASRGGTPLADGRRAGEGEYIAPEKIDPATFYGDDGGPQSAVAGDFIAAAAPPHLCWTEAVLGCPVQIVTGGPWAEPFAADWTHPATIQADERWLQKLDAFVQTLIRRADGRYPVVQPLMRGPIDMMASALGHEEMCMALLDRPAESEAFLTRCTDLFIETAQRRLQHTLPFAGGYLSSYGIWAPGTVCRTQVDNAIMLSPEVYRRQVLPHDRRIIEAFDFSLIHLHSGCLHIIDDLLAIEALRAVQVSIDYPGGPLAAEVLPVLERILQRKPLIVTGPINTGELRALESLTPPGGFCFQVELIDE